VVEELLVELKVSPVMRVSPQKLLLIKLPRDPQSLASVHHEIGLQAIHATTNPAVSRAQHTTAHHSTVGRTVSNLVADDLVAAIG
jgi:hypothetical protein